MCYFTDITGSMISKNNIFNSNDLIVWKILFLMKYFWFLIILIDIRWIIKSEWKSFVSNNLDFETLSVNLNDLFYCDEDNDSNDVFENKLAEERLQEEVESDINPSIYNTLDADSQQIILSEDIYDNIKQIFTKYNCSQDDYYSYNDQFIGRV